VYGVQPEAVDMIVFQPHAGILKEVIAYTVGPGTIKVQRGPPGGIILFAEIGCIVWEIVTFRSEMVIDHVYQHGNSPGVCCIDQALKAPDASIGMLDGEGVHSIIAPVALTRELSQGHEFDGVDTQIRQVVQAADDAFEIVGIGEAACMQFVDDHIAERQTFPFRILPGKVMRVGKGGRTVDTTGLMERCGVRVLLVFV
jgi:hypothetical protein